MTPAARVAAAITVLDDILAGRTAEQALSNWARNSRFAGSKDRAALRDHVFDALRRRASSAVRGGGLTGRGLMIGTLTQDGIDPVTVFTGEGHAPDELTQDEIALLRTPPTLSAPDADDLPAWLWPVWQADLKDAATPSAQALRSRAPLFLRVNNRRGTVQDAVAALAADQVKVSLHPTQLGCLRVETNPRRVKLSNAFTDGLVEVQDAASQIAISRIAIPAGARVLDYCAGGGGKALALADQSACLVVAHDVASQRTADIAPRAQRAGVQIEVAPTDQLAACDPFDVVVVDAPCSGSGTWRRNPEAKWQLTEDKLHQFKALQGKVLEAGREFVKAGGTLYYMTCSVFELENEAVVAAFISANPQWSVVEQMRLVPGDASDGFYLCQLTQNGGTPSTT